MREPQKPAPKLALRIGPPSASWGKLMGGDGVHFMKQGSEKLGTAVAAFLRERLPKR